MPYSVTNSDKAAVISQLDSASTWMTISAMATALSKTNAVTGDIISLMAYEGTIVHTQFGIRKTAS